MREPHPAPATPPIRGAIFDIGNVLIRLRPIDRVLASDSSRGSGGLPAMSPAGPFDPLSLLRSDPVADRFERGQATEGEFFGAVRRAFCADLPDEEIRRIYDGILGEPMPGMAEIIQDLRSRDIRVVGLTDISPGHLAIIGRYPAVRALEGVVASCVTAYRKPEPEAYRAALDRIGTDPAETLFTDDQPANVEGARRLGLQAVLFAGAESLRARLGLL